MLAPWKESHDQPRQNIKKQNITLLAKVHLVKAMVFPEVMYRCESWTMKKAECRRIDAFELWCWRRLLRVPRTARRSNQSILKEISSVQSLSRVWLFVTPWITACQASLSITSSQSSLKLTSIESVMPSSYLILLSPSPPTLNLSQHQGLFQWVSSSNEVAKVLEFQLQNQSFQWTPRTDLL